MKCERKFSRRAVALCLVGISLLFLLPSSATAQREREREFREDAAYEELIHHLEMGMVALEELGKGDALEMMARVANEVRAERKAAHEARGDRGQQSDDSHERELAQRLVKALRLTETACREAERPDARELAKHAYRALEMQLEGRRDEEARQYIKEAPPLGARIELLAMASELWAEWGHEERAAFTREMADTLKEQWNRRVERQRREGTGDLESLERRIDILRFARDAFAEVGDQKNAGTLTRAVRYGELILQGKTDDEELLAKAAEAVPSRRNLIEMLSWASARYREWGNEERSRVCKSLAEYYARKLREERGEEEERHESGTARIAGGLMKAPRRGLAREERG